MCDILICVCSATDSIRRTFAGACKGLADNVIERDSAPAFNAALIEALNGFHGVGIILLDIEIAKAGIDLAFYRSLCPNLAFILVTKNDIDDKLLVRQFEAGIDDFVPTAINRNVLEAKLRAFIRRMAPAGENKDSERAIVSATGLLQVDKTTFSVLVREKNINRRLNNFTPIEFKILELFAENSSIMMERRTILEHVWGNRADAVNLENVDKHIESIRRKLGAAGKKIKTVYGTGYMLCG